LVGLALQLDRIGLIPGGRKLGLGCQHRSPTSRRSRRLNRLDAGRL